MKDFAHSLSMGRPPALRVDRPGSSHWLSALMRTGRRAGAIDGQVSELVTAVQVETAC